MYRLIVLEIHIKPDIPVAEGVGERKTTSRPALMTCALPEMMVPVASCSSAADDDSMSEMTCCDMKTRKV